MRTASRPAARWRSKGVDLIGMVDDHGGIAEFFVDPSQTGRALLH
jgi:hypothetical protein